MGKKAVPIRDENYSKFKLANAGSPTDCTGLITVVPQDEDELENYLKVYDFMPDESDFGSSDSHTGN